MTELKDKLIRLIQHNSDRKVAEFASQFVHCDPEQKETILAGIEFERWLAETCKQSLRKSPAC